MYTEINFKSKKELKEAVKAGRRITIYQPGPFSKLILPNSAHCVEGPHYPQPHKWYASVTLGEDLCIKTVK